MVSPALSAGDNREARRILAALSALTADDVPEAARVSSATVVDLASKRKRRGRSAQRGDERQRRRCAPPTPEASAQTPRDPALGSAAKGVISEGAGTSIAPCVLTPLEIRRFLTLKIRRKVTMLIAGN
jgi:hypothetical protein